MEHQRDGVAFLDSVDGIGALLWEPGVGKTGATLAWIDKLATKQAEVRVLVVAPLTAADTWVLQPPSFMESVVKARLMQGTTSEILVNISRAVNWLSVPDAKIKSDHASGKNFNSRVTILSMSSGALSSYCDDRSNVVRALRAIRKYKPHVIVMDESHIIKSPTSNISKAMYQIGQLAPHRIILTGTVNPNSPLDCYGQWRFLAPWTFSDQYDEPWTKQPLLMTKAQQMAIRPWVWGRFRDRYSTKGGYKGKGIGGPNPDYIGELHDRVAERSMVVLKADALDLPPVVDVDVHVTLSPREAKAYVEMAEDLAAEMDSGELVEAVNALAKMMKLRQIAAGFVKDTDTGEVFVIGDSLRKAVREVVDVTLAGEQRVVVFAYFRSECALLADALRSKGQTVELITGQTPARERLAIRQRFADVSGNPQRTILVAQQRTMSLSVNELVVAQNAVFASQSERRDDWVQARGRLDRNGQVGTHVTFWNCFSPNLIGEIMLNRHKDKGNLEAALLNHVRQVARNRAI
jgi:hypothetical protein